MIGNKYKKVILTTLIFVFVFSSFFGLLPKKAEALGWPVIDIGHILVSGYQLILEEMLDGIAWGVANRAIEEIGKEAVDWINGTNSNEGSKFVTNMGDYLKDVADLAVGEFLRNELPLVCSPIRTQVQLEIVKYLRRDPYVQCTLSEAINNVENYADFINGNFFEGGWDSWLSVSRPVNNVRGATQIALEKIQANINNKQGEAVRDYETSGGFTSWKDCDGVWMCPVESTDGPSTYITGAPWTPGSCSVSVRYCSGKTVVNTPGSVIEEQLNRTIGSGLNRLEAADEINEIIGAILNRLTTSVLSSGGLRNTKIDSGNFTNDGQPPAPPGIGVDQNLCARYGICDIEPTDPGGGDGPGVGVSLPVAFCEAIGVARSLCVGKPGQPSPDPFMLCAEKGISSEKCQEILDDVYGGGDGNIGDTTRQCNDGVDNDGDGKIDLEDMGCRNSSDNTENSDDTDSEPASCSDGKDNDGDGKTDYPSDPGCAGAGDTSEKDEDGGDGGGGGGGGGAGVPNIDLSKAIIASNSAQDIAKWEQNSTILSTSVTNYQICVNHDKINVWPEAYDGIMGNAWIFAYINGAWHGGTYEWLKGGKENECKALGSGGSRTVADMLAQHIKQGPLASWKPRKGDTVYLMVSTIARDGGATSPKDYRSDLKKIIWPY